MAFALKEFHGVPHTRTVAEVTGQIGLSPRRFIQVFSSEVGLTPTLFCRIRRFQRVLRLIAKGDQAHFIHDFRAFSGINPTTYLAQRTEHLNHVPILD